MEGAIVEGIGDFTFVAGDDPNLVEYFFLLLAKQHVVGVDACVDKMRFWELGLLMPLFSGSSHCKPLFCIGEIDAYLAIC